MAGAERVFDMLDRQPEWHDAPERPRLPRSAGRVEFRDVTFGYDPDRPVLHEMNFIAEPGQTVALVGHTGSGKTSIINLIAKFYLPDQRAGADRRPRFARDHCRSRCGARWASCCSRIFCSAARVLDNIRFGRPEASRPAKCVEAVARLDCLDLLESLPQGLQTPGRASGAAAFRSGQRQIVCFARAMLADPAHFAARRSHQQRRHDDRGPHAARRWRCCCAGGPASSWPTG